MGARRTAVKMALPLYGALFLAFLGLSLLFSIFQPAPQLVRAQSGEVWFNVDFQAPGYRIYSRITVYKDGKAHGEGTYTGYVGVGTYTFEGQYDKVSRTISGDLKYNDPYEELVDDGDCSMQLKFVDSRNLTGTSSGNNVRTDGTGWSHTEPVSSTVTGKSDRDVEEEATTKPDKNGYDEYGYDKDGYDKNGYDEYGNKKESGGESGSSEGEGSKIPGPESWWQWLTGTVVAGTVAAGLGLAGTLLGSAPPTPPLMGVFDPSPPDIAGGPAQLPSSVEIGLPPPETGLIDQTLMNIGDDIGTVPGYLYDKAKWAFNGLTDMDNLKDAMNKTRELMEGSEQWKDQKARQAVDYLHETTHDPLKPFKDLEEAKKQGAKYIAENLLIPMLQDPLGALKSLLGIELWEKAMDPNIPLPERFAYSAIATLNTIGLIEGASGLKNWVFGGGKKAAVGEALTGKVVPELKSPKSAWKKAVSTPEGKIAANTTWKEQVAAGKGKIKAWKEAMREGGDAEARTRALLEIRRDPAALKNLNDEGSRALVTKYNKGINGLQDSALEKGRKTLVGEFGVSDEQVRIFKATNRSTGVTAKNDLDFTYQVKKDGKWVDVPSPKAQEHFDQAFHEGVGSPSDVTPGRLSKDLRCKAVAQHDAEALGLERADFNAAKSGKTAPNPQTVGQGIEYKVNENLVEADRLTAAGDIAGANTQRSLAQREISKAYNNQIEGRIKYLKERGGNMALVDKKIAGVEDAVRDMKAMQKRNATPADIGEMLGKRGWTEESLGKRMGEIYEELNR